MLTWDEVSDTLREAGNMRPEEFEKLIADYIPQTILPKLIEDIYRNNMVHFPDEEISTILTTHTMVGFHMGWLLAMKAVLDARS